MKRLKNKIKIIAIPLIGLMAFACQQTPAPKPGDVLPFPEPPSASTTGKTLADSKHQWRTTENHLPKDAPNIVIFMTDDA
ncbi:MAG: hypothetical protein V2I62_03265, partial [Bacteroidales bacterium]|nr:hypothetical protein [Bacteroidales bacterium]